MPAALITCLHLQRQFSQFQSQYDKFGVNAVLPPLSGQQLNAGEMRTHIDNIDVVIAGDDVIDASVLQAGKASKLRAIVKWGIGTDSIDENSAADLGIPVFNTPGVFSDEVADLAMCHLLMLVRKPHVMHSSVLGGAWQQVSGHTLRGRTAGVIGLGSIGLGIVRRCAAFGMNVIGFDIRELMPEELAQSSLRQTDLDSLFSDSDVVFVACNLTSENRHMVSDSAFARMREHSYLINVGRGPLVDQKALVDALESNKIAGAGLDVFEEEPVSKSNPLHKYSDRCVFTTHCGSNTIEAVARINQMTTDIVFDVLGLKKIEDFAPNRVA